jgi:hypothetical protein
MSTNWGRFLIMLLCFQTSLSLSAQSPHGAALKLDCAACHSPTSWEIPAGHWTDVDKGKPRVSPITGIVLAEDSGKFTHDDTGFSLVGRHETVNCRDCHETLVFAAAEVDCISCHTDIHQMTLGNDCARCHTSNNWLVDDVQGIHFDNGFPLNGVHANINCVDCHTSETTLRFDRLGNDCINCHQVDFNNTSMPNHAESGFPTDCVQCHDVFTPGWRTDQISNHDFFPLTQGHDIADCNRCHVGGNFANTPNECVACHQADFAATTAPNHTSAGISNDCAACHTTAPDWMPAQFSGHDAEHFPIYSGTHNGVWAACTDCHTNPANFAEFSCTNCHTNPQTDNSHQGIGGYAYEDNACLACHPTGDAFENFDHNQTAFPLHGAHQNANCIDCHASGYAGTPTACAACHIADYNSTTNPSHTSAQFPTSCEDCHTDTAWTPATFDHDNMYFPIYSGKHRNEWNQCSECHTTAGNYELFSCTDCHEHNNASSLANEHEDVSGYQFVSTACFACHPNGR